MSERKGIKWYSRDTGIPIRELKRMCLNAGLELLQKGKLTVSAKQADASRFAGITPEPWGMTIGPRSTLIYGTLDGEEFEIAEVKHLDDAALMTAALIIRSQRDEAFAFLEEIEANVEVPDINCSCHISPPCGCDYARSIGELMERARNLIQKGGAA